MLNQTFVDLLMIKYTRYLFQKAPVIKRKYRLVIRFSLRFLGDSVFLLAHDIYINEKENLQHSELANVLNSKLNCTRKLISTT